MKSLVSLLRQLFVASLVFTGVAAYAGSAKKTLEIYWVDSEGGGSTLIVTPAGESILIDSGNPGGRDSGRIVAAAKAAGLTRIDHFLLTHFHTDHFGGIAEVAAALPVGVVYDKGIPEGNPDGKSASSFPLLIKPYREFKADNRVTLKPGMVIPLRSEAGGARLELRCLGANKTFVQPATGTKPNALPDDVPAKPVDGSDNANSAVFVLQFGDFRFFDGGDLKWNIEKTLVLPYNLVGTVDVYQAQHHGLDQSNHPALIKSLEPSVAVFNNGPRKGSEAGTFATVASIASIQAVYQLHRNLGVGSANTASELIANEHEKCDANLVMLSVEPDARHYTVSIPATGHTRRFETKKR